ncbi:MAG TPA: carbohydrate-binding domain-containing protein [Planctomycetota bacterium]|nr:carbohydrate-binding domain-containing protein [Planctomycetota bacterium]HRR79950.1 carbohydrate-binding domain-containing protein [Planctomycetota bacterium]
MNKIRHLRVLLLLCAGVALAAPPRQELSLNGEWACSIPPGKPSRVMVPGYLSGVDDEVAALSREFAVPEAMRGQRLKLRFGSVKFNSTVLVNGKQVATHFGGYEPFEVDVTDAVSVEKPNQLAVRCHTWAGVMTDGPKQFSKAGGWDQVRSAPRDRILAPIGGLYGLYGIWDDVTLVSHPAVYIKDLFIKPSVRRSELVVDYTLANESEADAEVELSAVVEEAVTLSKTTVKVPAGKTATVSLKAPWPKPRLWSHADPHLYALKSQIANRKSQINDEVVTRFGFREFWCQGPDFYLNGSKMHLLASSGWPPHGPQTREEIAAFWNGLKACGCVAFRTHTQPWPAAYYDVADELGLLVIPEGAVWNDDDVYRVNDPAFWDNYAAHLAAMVGSLKNHPSVVMWSLENEFTGGRVNDNTPYPKEQLIRLGKLVKQLDPTRPIMYESDGDPGGVADVIGIHYPHEYPDYTCWPNEGYWLDKPSPGSGGGGIFLNGEKQFLWKRDKPLYIGEFLWVPSSDPAPHTIFFGDDAYRDYHLYRNLAKAEAWKMQILAYRVQGVSGICPWTVTEGGPLDDTNALWRAHKWAYQPIAAYCLDYDSRFYAGEKVTRRIAIFSDILEPSKLTLSWTLSLGGKTVAEGSEKVELGPAGQQGLNVTVPMPSVDERTPAQWRVTLDRDGRRAFDETHAYAVFPRPTLPKLAARIGLYDPKGATRKLFESNDLAAAPVEALDKLPAGLDVLVIGAGAFAAEKAGGPVIGRVDPRRAALDTFTAQGGRVLVLEQQAYPEGLFGFGLTSHSSTMAFPLQSDHPILHGLALGPGGLRFWRGDNLVAEREPTRPASGAFCPIIVSGSAAGLDHAPLLQRFVGRGCIVHAQLKLVEKFTAEPIAAQLLGRLLTFLAEYRPKERRTAVAGGSPDYRACLRRLGLRFDDLTGRLAGADLSRYSLLICRGDVRDADRILQFIRQGGAVLAHRLSPEAFQELRRAFGLDLTLAHYSGIASRADTDPLGFLAREDLYWLGEHRGISWAETPRAGNMADSVLGLSLDPAKAKSHEVEGWALQGGIVERREDHVVFATVGSATGEVEFPEDGLYVFGIVGRGTPCHGDYPIASVAVDGRTLGAVSVDSPQVCTRTTFGEVAKGRHKVTVSFTNDASDPAKGEDRNLIVDKLLIARHEKKGDLLFLTTPPAVACLPRGEGLLVLDFLRWDTEERNARKAARYASTLLAALGGDFADRPSWAIECETMSPQPDMGWFRADNTAAHLACNGWIKTPIEVAVAGRYTMELVAGGTPAQGVYPDVEISVDGKKAGEVQLTGGGLRPYPVAIDLPAGKHELALRFTNDLNVGGEDRNLTLDKVVFYRE